MNAAAESVSIQAIVSGAPEEEPSGGGGGGGSPSPSEETEDEIVVPPSSVFFSGVAYPEASVFLLKNGQQAEKTIARTDAAFSILLPDLTPGSYTFSVVAEDANGRRSTLRTFPIRVSENVATTISDILISPTVYVNLSSVVKGEPLVVSGYGAPLASVVLTLRSAVSSFFSLPTTVSGEYTTTLDTAVLPLGSYQASAHTLFADESESPESALISFSINDQELPFPEETYTPADINYDMRVNLVDFSILAYWYNKDVPPAKVDLNGDGRVTITDFSMLAYAWTG